MPTFIIRENEDNVPMMLPKQIIDHKKLSCMAKYLLILLIRYEKGTAIKDSMILEAMKIDKEKLDSLWAELENYGYAKSGENKRTFNAYPREFHEDD